MSSPLGVVPSVVQVATQQNYLASNSAYDLRKPYISPDEAQVWGSGDITGLMDKLGGKNFVPSSFYRHFETTRLHTIVNATGATSSDLNPVTYTIVAADSIPTFPNGVYDPYIALGAITGQGTGYATTMCIDNNHDLFVFDQKLLKWFTWSYLSSKFIECELPKITEQDFAGIGTRNITEDGINAIKDLYDNTFN